MRGVAFFVLLVWIVLAAQPAAASDQFYDTWPYRVVSPNLDVPPDHCGVSILPPEPDCPVVDPEFYGFGGSVHIHTVGAFISRIIVHDVSEAPVVFKVGPMLCVGECDVSWMTTDSVSVVYDPGAFTVNELVELALGGTVYSFATSGEIDVYVS